MLLVVVLFLNLAPQLAHKFGSRLVDLVVSRLPQHLIQTFMFPETVVWKPFHVKKDPETDTN